MEYKKTKKTHNKIFRRVTNENDKYIPKERYISPKNDRKLLII